MVEGAGRGGGGGGRLLYMESEVLFPLCHVENSRPLREVYVEIVVEDKQLFTADSHHRSAPTGLPSPTSWNCIPWLGEEQMV